MSWRWAGRRLSCMGWSRLKVPARKAAGRSLPLAEELLDAPVDGILVGDLGERHVLGGPDRVAEVLDELAGAVGALHLPVAEQVHDRQDARLQDLDAEAGVVGAPVVAVGEVEGVDVPGRRAVL